jgi:hypothetical protein
MFMATIGLIFSFIPGNVAPGLLFRKPDHFENYDDWPFFWGQNEGRLLAIRVMRSLDRL